MSINVKLQAVLFLISAILLSITGFLVWSFIKEVQPGQFVQILAGISLLVIFLSHGLLRSTRKSIKELLRGTEVIGSGNLEYKINLEYKDELGQLAASFNKMTENLQKITISRDYSDSIIRSIIGGLIVLSQDRCIRSVNAAACEMLGYNEDELTGMSFNKIFVSSACFSGSGRDEPSAESSSAISAISSSASLSIASSIASVTAISSATSTFSASSKSVSITDAVSASSSGNIASSSAAKTWPAKKNTDTNKAPANRVFNKR